MGRKVLIAGYPRSGNTWLGYMLAYLLGARYVDLTTPDSKSTHWKRILDLIGGDLSHNSDFEGVYKTHSAYKFYSEPDGLDLESFDRVIHIVRDPRDVAVSYFFFTYYNVPIARGQPEKVVRTNRWLADKLRWKKMVRQVAREWPSHTLSWQAYEGARLFRYEDVYQRSREELSKICDYLEVEPDASILEKGIRDFAFDRLAGGRKPGEECQVAFYRKGVVGDYRPHFSRFDTWVMERGAGAVMRRLGYAD